MTVAPSPSPPPSRQDRRKAETRRKIVDAAETLFQEKGYAATSIEDIATAADVAVRTIYLHFSSKAGIVLSYFDSWMAAFVAAVMTRPADEPVVETVTAALEDMALQGWTERVENEEQMPHPLVELLRTGPTDVAGHVTQAWLEAISDLTADAARRSPSPEDDLAPYSRAIAIYAYWFAGLGAAGEKQRGATIPARTSALSVLATITQGI